MASSVVDLPADKYAFQDKSCCRRARDKFAKTCCIGRGNCVTISGLVPIVLDFEATNKLPFTSQITQIGAKIPLDHMYSTAERKALEALVGDPTVKDAHRLQAIPHLQWDDEDQAVCFKSYVKCTAKISTEAARITKITATTLQHAWPLRRVLCQMWAWIGACLGDRSGCFVCHNGNYFDIPLLFCELEESCGQNYRSVMLKNKITHIFDSYIWSKYNIPDHCLRRKPDTGRLSRALVYLHLAEFGETFDEAHDALADVRGLYRLLYSQSWHKRGIDFVVDDQSCYMVHEFCTVFDGKKDAHDQEEERKVESNLKTRGYEPTDLFSEALQTLEPNEPASPSPPPKEPKPKREREEPSSSQPTHPAKRPKSAPTQHAVSVTSSS